MTHLAIKSNVSFLMLWIGRWKTLRAPGQPLTALWKPAVQKGGVGSGVCKYLNGFSVRGERVSDNADNAGGKEISFFNCGAGGIPIEWVVHYFQFHLAKYKDTGSAEAKCRVYDLLSIVKVLLFEMKEDLQLRQEEGGVIAAGEGEEERYAIREWLRFSSQKSLWELCKQELVA